MIIFIKQYFKLIGYALIGLVFMFSAFYLLANGYHYLEIRKDFVTSFDEQSVVTSLDEKLNKVRENVGTFNANTYNGKVSTSQMMIVNQNINQCLTSFNNETITNMRGKDRISIIDVYYLRESFENDVLNSCIINNLFFTTAVDESFGSQYLLNNKELSKLYIDSLARSYTSYLKKDLINNSSYYYNTSVSSSSVKDNTRDGFYEVMDAYNRAADFLLYVSNWFRMEVGA